MTKLNCSDCIHNEVCYKRSVSNIEYANICGDYIDVNMIIDEIKKAMEDKNETN